MKQKDINNSFIEEKEKGHIYDTAIFGMGYFALGYARTHENTVIIERAELCDTAFCGCMNVGEDWDYIPTGSFATGFREMLINKKLLCGKSADVLSLESVLCEYIKSCLPDILLLTNITAVKKQNDYYRIAIYNNAGQSEIYAKKIIDTTPRGVFFAERNYRKLLSLFCFTKQEDFAEAAKKVFGREALVRTTPQPFDRILSIPCDKDETLLASSTRIADVWEETLAEQGYKISKIAGSFIFETQSALKYIDEFYEAFCECNTKNAFIAADAGESFKFKNSI